MEKAACQGLSSYPRITGDVSASVRSDSPVAELLGGTEPIAPPAEPFDPVVDVEFGLPILGGAVWVEYYRGDEPMHAVMYVDADRAVETCLEGLIKLSGFDNAVPLTEALDMVGAEP